MKISRKLFLMVLKSKMTKSLTFGGSFCLFTPRMAKMYFLGIFEICQLICTWILEKQCSFAAFFLNFVNVFSALSVFFNISMTVESHIYKLYLNNLNHHRSKWSGFSEIKTPSIVRFNEKYVLYNEYYF